MRYRTWVWLLIAVLGSALVAGEGVADTVFSADFQNSVVQDDTTDANLNAGTAVGTWSGLPTGVDQLEGARLLEDGANRALLLDRFEETVGPINLDANFTQPIALDGAVIEFKTAIRRTQNNVHDKNSHYIAYDATGKRALEVQVTALTGTTIPNEVRRVAYVHPTNGLTMVPQGAPSEIGGSNITVANLSQFSTLKISCAAAGYTIQFTGPGGTPTWTSEVLPYIEAVTSLTKFNFWGLQNPTTQSAGFWIDDVVVTGTPVAGEGEGEGEGEPQGNEILSNVYPPFIDAGTTVVLTAPPGSGWQWAKDLADITGATDRELVFNPVQLSDAGSYTVTYDNGTKLITTTPPFVLTVSPEGAVPVGGAVALATLLGACALGGASALRRRK